MALSGIGHSDQNSSSTSNASTIQNLTLEDEDSNQSDTTANESAVETGSPPSDSGITLSTGSCSPGCFQESGNIVMSGISGYCGPSSLRSDGSVDERKEYSFLDSGSFDSIPSITIDYAEEEEERVHFTISEEDESSLTDCSLSATQYAYTNSVDARQASRKHLKLREKMNGDQCREFTRNELLYWRLYKQNAPAKRRHALQLLAN